MNTTAWSDNPLSQQWLEKAADTIIPTQLTINISLVVEWRITTVGESIDIDGHNLIMAAESS